MHRKSIEAAETLKDENCNTSSDHDETTSQKTECSEHSGNSSTVSISPGADRVSLDVQVTSSNNSYHQIKSPESFRNNSIACLRAKAEEHSAKFQQLMQNNHNMTARDLATNMLLNSSPNCDSNANNLTYT